jgi:hypothetical protein
MMMLSASATTSRLGLAAPRKARTQLLAPRTVVARVAAKPFKSPIPGELATALARGKQGDGPAAAALALVHQHATHQPPPKPPTTAPQEEASSAHEAFMHALESAKPVSLCMPGLQQFAAAVRGVWWFRECWFAQLRSARPGRCISRSRAHG